MELSNFYEQQRIYDSSDVMQISNLVRQKSENIQRKQIKYSKSQLSIQKQLSRISSKQTINQQQLNEEQSDPEESIFTKTRKDIANAFILSGNNPRQILLTLRETFLQLVDADYCNIFILRPEGDLMFEGTKLSSTNRVTQGNIKQVTQEKQYLIINSPPEINGITTSFYIPLLKDNQVFAVIETLNQKKEEKQLQEWMSNEDSGYLRQLLVYVSKTLDFIISYDTTASLDYENTNVKDSTLMNLVHPFTKIVKASRCRIYSVDTDAAVIWSSGNQYFKPSVVKLGKSIAGYVAETGKRLNLEDAHLNPHYIAEFDQGKKSLLCVPCEVHGKVLGVIEMINKIGNTNFDEEDEKICIYFSSHVAKLLYRLRLDERVIRAQNKAQILLDVSAVLFQELDLNLLLNTIVETLKKPLNASKCSIFLSDEIRDDFWSPIGADLAHIRIKKDQGIAGAVALKGNVINIVDAYNDERFSPEIDKLTGFLTASILAVPIKHANGKILGVLELINNTNKQYFDKDDEQMAVAISYYLALAINNAHLFESAKSAKRKSDALLKIMHSVSSHHDVGEMFEAVGNSASDILNADHSTLFLVDPFNQQLYCKVGSEFKGFVMSTKCGIPGKCYQSKELIVCEDAYKHPAFDGSYDSRINYRTKSILCAPVLSQDTVIAVIQVVNKKESKFNEEDLKILQAIAIEISSELERKSLEVLFTCSSDSMPGITTDFLSQYTNKEYRKSSLFAEKESPLMSWIDCSPSERASSVADKLLRWDFSPWEYNRDELSEFVIDIFHTFNLLEYMNVELTTMRRFTLAVRGQYHDVPYHNFLHAFTTLQVTFMIAKTTDVRYMIDIQDILALCIAAYCHDMGHDGRTNAFHVKSRSSIALLYNDQSVLENMHAAACFETMRKPGHDILKNITDDYMRIRKTIVTAILATDMQGHCDMLSRLQVRMKKDIFNKNDLEDRKLLLNAIVHSADIANPTMSPHLSKKWANMLVEEFNAQYNDELKQPNISKTPYMNAKPNSPEQASLNIAFIDSCVFPLWKILSDFVGGLDVCMNNVLKNREAWTKKLLTQETQSNSD